jgi:RHS repeat-associated protein
LKRFGEHEIININRNFGNFTENLEEFNYFYTYDGMNRMFRVDVAKHNPSIKKYIISYVYNDVNNAVKYEISGNDLSQLIEYDYDVRDRILNKKSWLMDYRLFYDGNMPQTDWTGHTVVSSNNYNGNINGMQINYKFDPASNQSITNFELPTIYGYQYDKLNRLKQADAIIGDFVHAAGYSQESFLIGDENYSYDRIGNLKTLSRHNRATSGTTFAQIESFVYSYQTATNRLASVLGQAGTPSRAYTYDKNGNLLTDNSKQISQTIYERANYPYQITKGTEQYSYLYDANDQRIYKKTVNGTLITEEYYLKDAMGRDIALWKAPNNGNYNWVYQIHGTKLEARIDKRLRPLIGDDVGDGPDIQSNDLLYFHYDHLGNTRITYRKNQDDFSIEYAADYMPYGKIVREYRNGGNIEKYLTTHHERDQETQLDYRGARYYDCDVARFLSLDPKARDFVSWSAYNYVLGNPIMLIDADGKAPTDWFLNNKTGRLIYIQGQSTVSQGALNSLGSSYKPSDYQRVGGDKMFGDFVRGDNGQNLLDQKVAYVADPQDMMESIGLIKAENVLVKEREFVSKGTTDIGERVSSTHYTTEQVGESKIQYVTPDKLNQKSDMNKSVYDSKYSTITTVDYGLTKKYGQKNEVNSYFRGNQKADNYGKTFDLIKNLKGLF